MSDASPRIVEFDSKHAEALRQVFETTTADCAHCHSVDSAIFVETLSGKTESAVNECVLVSIGPEGPSGFCHALIQNPEDQEGTLGAIRFLGYAPGDRGSGLALLRAAVDYCQSSGVARIRAFHQRERYPFYHRNHAYLSDRIGHIQALLSCEGFRKQGGEVHLDWENCEPGEPFEIEQPVDLTWVSEESAGSIPAFKGKAMMDETLVGECHVASCADCHASQGERLFVNWLGVEEDFQGKGYGRYILQEALREGRRLGYQHAAISTAFNNHRAYAFYTNYGFRVTDWTYGWELSDDGKGAQG